MFSRTQPKPSTGGRQSTSAGGFVHARRTSASWAFIVSALLGTAAFEPNSALAAKREGQPTIARYSVALIDIVPDRSATGASLLRLQARSLGAIAGCLRVELIRQPPPSANHFILLTVWRNAASRDRYLESSVSSAIRTQLQPLVASPVDDRGYARMAL